MNVFDYLNKINGASVSTPVLGIGIQWNNENNNREKEIANRVLSFLEDRGVLYIEGQAEIPEYCIRSIERIRSYLTTEISELPVPNRADEISDLEICLRQMRSACQTMMKAHNEKELSRLRPFRGNELGKNSKDLDFIMDLVTLRTVFAINIKKISDRYSIPLRDENLKKLIDEICS